MGMEEDTLRQQGGLPSIGGKIEWRQAAEKRKRTLEQNEEQNLEQIQEATAEDQMSMKTENEDDSMTDEEENREQNFIIKENSKKQIISGILKKESRNAWERIDN